MQRAEGEAFSAGSRKAKNSEVWVMRPGVIV